MRARSSPDELGGDKLPRADGAQGKGGVVSEAVDEPHFAAPESDIAQNEDFLFHLYRGSELLQDNRVHDAKDELERALELQPSDAKGQDLLAVVYFRLGLYPRAIAIYEQLRRRNPSDASLLLNLALCYLKTGQAPDARRDLETLVEVNPNHARAWGYLGLACERLGDLPAAQRAFERGGHTQMARRIGERRAVVQEDLPAQGPEVAPAEPQPREVIAAAFEELDAGELSFSLAEPSSPAPAPSSWSAVELGQAVLQNAILQTKPETQKPDTKDGPPPARVGFSPPSVSRRPTLIAPAPPAAEVYGLPLDKHPSPTPPAVSELPPSIRRPFVAVPPVRVPGIEGVLPVTPEESRRRTLPPPNLRPPSSRPPAVAELAERSGVEFPEPGAVVMHASGVALVRVSSAGFATRLEAMRASSNGLAVKLLERHMKGKATGESFGGVASPMVQAAGEGQLVLGPRAGRKISSFVLEDEMCFVREDVLLGFHGALAFENGRLATGEGEFLSVVQLRGSGDVLVEAMGEILSLEIEVNRGMSVRREAILGWFGRLVPRSLSPNDAPAGQRGLISFAGRGRVLITSV